MLMAVVAMVVVTTVVLLPSGKESGASEVDKRIALSWYVQFLVGTQCSCQRNKRELWYSEHGASIEGSLCN
jgi:hypothetical protein